MNIKKNSLIALIGLAVAFGAATNASAAANAEPNHPRRDQVIDRLNNQTNRIRDERKEGDLTASQAKQLHSEDRSIYQQEQFDAKLNGGHITKTEQKALNQEENAVSKQIGK